MAKPKSGPVTAAKQAIVDTVVQPVKESGGTLSRVVAGAVAGAGFRCSDRASGSGLTTRTSGSDRLQSHLYRDPNLVERFFNKIYFAEKRRCIRNA